ncbi:MAG: hypothetical protein ACJAT4_002181 [Granulosicoccus sp.]|jgi:hypothetical protein
MLTEGGGVESALFHVVYFYKKKYTEKRNDICKWVMLKFLGLTFSGGFMDMCWGYAYR